MYKFLGVFFIFCNITIAQSLQFSSGNYNLKKLEAHNFKICKQDVFMNQAHLAMQFQTIPTQEEKKSLEKSGIQFLHYIPQNAYIISVNKNYKFQSNKNILSISKVQNDWKLQELLAKKAYPSHAIVKRTQIQLIVSFYSDINFVLAQKHLELNKISILSTNKDNQQINIQIPINQINKVASYPFVQFIEPISIEPVPDNYTGGTLNKINHVYNDWSTGSSYNGAGVNVMLQDDGIIGPHIDYQGRVIHYVSSNSGDHGDHVGGTIMGGGNLNPQHRGMAWGATIHVYNANDNNYNLVPSIYVNDKILITSKSYAQSCNGGYTAICNQLDKQLRDFPSLQHFFSAGNTGTSDCGYGAGANWGNITGGHKSAKNTIAVGNTTWDGVLAGSSSRGPATDGRIKPDVCSKGTDVMSTTISAIDISQYVLKTGTSMSCPMASGTMSVLYEAYQKNNAGNLPYNALMKGIFLNTADDYGNPGPDFKYGFGIVNAKRALKVIKQKSYLIDSITQGSAKTHVFSVPSGTKRLKLMVYWNDKEAASGAKPALVNDINITATDNGNLYYPLRLNPKASAVSLDQNAYQGIDSLNNVEQIVIENPSLSCTLDISGFAIPFGPQKYCVILDYIEEGIRLLYPSGKEKMRSGDPEIIRWESIDTTNKIVLKFSTNGGNTWVTLSNNLNAKFRSYSWTPTNVQTDKLMFKVEQDIFVDSNSVTSTIMSIPAGLALIKNCGDSLILRWNATTNTKRYIVYALGQKYMDSIASVTTNEYIKLCNNPYDITYYAVASVHNNDFVGKRCVAIPKLAPTNNCSSVGADLTISRLINPSLSFSRNCQGKVDLLVIAKVANLSNIALSNFKTYYKIDTFPFVSINNGALNGYDSVTVTFPASQLPINYGISRLKIWVEATSDLIKCNDTIVFDLNISKEELRTLIREDFESFKSCSSNNNCGSTVCGLSKGWVNEVNGVTDDIDWRVYAGPTPSGFQGTGPSVDANPGTSTGQYVYLEASNCFTKVANLVSPCIDLNNMTNPNLSFKYHMYGTNINALHIDVYNGVTWNLDIIPTISGNKGNQWNTQNIDLSAFTGIINIRFRGLTGTGSLGDMALDDFSVYSKSTVKAEFNTTDPLCANTKIRFNNTSLNSNQHVWTFGPDATPATSIAQDYVDVTFQSPGEKTIKLLAINPNFMDSMTIKIQVEDIPKPNFTYNNIGNDYSFTNTSLYGASYDWKFGDGNSATLSNPNNKFLVNGNYTVTLKATGNCGEDSVKKNLLIAFNQINDFTSNGFLSIIPNPANEYLKVNTTTPLKGKWMYKIFTTDGKLQLANDFNQQEKINIQSLPKGVYLLYLKQGNQDHYQKFIKE